MTIRRATIADTVAVLDLLRAAHDAAAADQLYAFDAGILRSQFHQHLASAMSLCLVHDVAGIARGVFVAFAADYPKGRVRGAIEWVRWIDPGHRGNAWFEMRREFERWAAEQNCKFSALTVAEQTDPRFVDSLTRQGYRPFETHYLKMI